MSERDTSQVTDSLNNRIVANQQFGNMDLTSWLRSRLLLCEGETLLDVGCGTGKHLVAFAKATAIPYSCTGMDLSASSLDDAKAAAEKEGVQIKLVQKSMDDLDHEQGAYHTISSIYALYYCKDAQHTLANLHRLLAKHGRIVIMGPYNENNKEWFKFINQFMELPENVKKSTTTFMRDEVLKYALKHFGKITCERFVNTLRIPSKEELTKYWRSNIYYKEEHDHAFEKFATKHFATHPDFRYSKVGLLITMSEPFVPPNSP